MRTVALMGLSFVAGIWASAFAIHHASPEAAQQFMFDSRIRKAKRKRHLSAVK